MHPVFHISLLKKFVDDPASVLPLESVVVKDNNSYEDVPVEILNRQVGRLRNKEVTSVKVFCRSQSLEGATWEVEAAMKAKYPYLFPSDSAPAWGNSSSSVLQSFMRKFSFKIMIPQFVLQFLA